MKNILGPQIEYGPKTGMTEYNEVDYITVNPEVYRHAGLSEVMQ